MSGRTIEIAEHLWAVLETMARDMATEPRALVNQAVYNWARRNGYAVSAGAAQAEAPAPAKAAPAVAPPAQAPAPAAVAAPVARPEVVLVEDPVPEAKPQPTAAAKPATPAPVAVPAVSQAARIAAIDADVDRYCLVPVVVDAEFEDDASADNEAEDDAPEEDQEQVEEEEQEEEAQVVAAVAAPAAPAVDVAVLRAAVAERVAAIDRAVDDVLPRPRVAATTPIPVPVAAPTAPAAPPRSTVPAPAPAPAAAAPTPAPAAVAAAPSPSPAAARPTLQIAPASLVTAPAAAPAPEPAPAPGKTKRMDTSQLNELLGEVDDILSQNIVRDTALSPAIPFVLELRVRGTNQVCTVATEPVIIGRGSHCDLVVQSNEASREHAVVSRNGGTYVIEDRGSSNGTWFGGEQVRSREIHSGDVFRIGSVDVVASFKVGDAQAKAG